MNRTLLLILFALGLAGCTQDTPPTPTSQAPTATATVEQSEAADEDDDAQEETLQASTPLGHRELIRTLGHDKHPLIPGKRGILTI